MQLPDTALGLIDELNRLVPERIPDVGANEQEVQRYNGKRELVLFLNHWRDANQREPSIRKMRR